MLQKTSEFSDHCFGDSRNHLLWNKHAVVEMKAKRAVEGALIPFDSPASSQPRLILAMQWAFTENDYPYPTPDLIVRFKSSKQLGSTWPMLILRIPDREIPIVVAVPVCFLRRQFVFFQQK